MRLVIAYSRQGSRYFYSPYAGVCLVDSMVSTFENMRRNHTNQKTRRLALAFSAWGNARSSCPDRDVHPRGKGCEEDYSETVRWLLDKILQKPSNHAVTVYIPMWKGGSINHWRAARCSCKRGRVGMESRGCIAGTFHCCIPPLHFTAAMLKGLTSYLQASFAFPCVVLAYLFYFLMEVQ
jgi:hypothetical protein